MTPISWSGVKDEEGQWDGLGAQTALAQAGSPVQSQNLSGALHGENSLGREERCRNISITSVPLQ